MKWKYSRVLVLFYVSVAVWSARNLQADPPFSGTIFIDPDIITSSDPTTFQDVTDAGRGMRQMFDRRVPGWINVEAFLFAATYDDGLTIEVQVNPEFGSAVAALAEARKYAEVIGRLPTVLRADVETAWIHRGVNPFGGGNRNLLIHVGQAERYIASGILEETLVHEAAHTSLDGSHASALGWLAAQNADGEFISTYARDFPQREDIAESFVPYLAVRYRSERITPSLANTISKTIPNRIAYFDLQAFDLYPVVMGRISFGRVRYDKTSKQVTLTWNSRPGGAYRLVVSGDLVRWHERGALILSDGDETSTSLDAGMREEFFRIIEQVSQEL